MSTSEQWHKALVLVMRKLGIVEILITDDDMRPLLKLPANEQLCAIIDQQVDGLHVRLATVEQAKEYAAMTAVQNSPILKPN